MIKNQFLAFVAGVTCLGFTACQNDGFKRTSDGLQYRIVEDKEGDKHPEIGDILKVHIKISIADSTMVNSYTMNNGQPFEFPYLESKITSDWTNGLPLLSAGDSAIFMVPVDSVRKQSNGNLPPFAKDGDNIVYEVRLVSVQGSQEVEAARKKAAEGQMKIDDKELQAYFKTNNIDAQKTESGLYYVIDKAGSGAQIKEGQLVTVNYTGMSLKGKKFDSNVDPKFQHVEPFSFTVGRKEVIQGWDEGIQQLKKGTKARLFIPSPLAYGPRDMGPEIGPNAVLVFEVEITDVNDVPNSPNS